MEYETVKGHFLQAHRLHATLLKMRPQRLQPWNIVQQQLEHRMPVIRLVVQSMMGNGANSVAFQATNFYFLTLNM